MLRAVESSIYKQYQPQGFASYTFQQIGPWKLNAHSNQLIQGDLVIELEHRLTNLLVYFLRHKQKILSKNDILKAIWKNKVVNDDSLSVAISKLRKALDDNPRTPKYIKTIPGIGYQFIMQESHHTYEVPFHINPSALKSHFLLIISAAFAITMIATVVIASVFDITKAFSLVPNQKVELNADA